MSVLDRGGQVGQKTSAEAKLGENNQRCESARLGVATGEAGKVMGS